MTLRELKPSSQEDVIGTIERALADARDGKIRSVMVASIHHDGTFSAGWMGPNTFFEKLGVLEQIKHEMMRDGERSE